MGNSKSSKKPVLSDLSKEDTSAAVATLSWDTAAAAAEGRCSMGGGDVGVVGGVTCTGRGSQRALHAGPAHHGLGTGALELRAHPLRSRPRTATAPKPAPTAG